MPPPLLLGLQEGKASRKDNSNTKATLPGALGAVASGGSAKEDHSFSRVQQGKWVLAGYDSDDSDL